MSDDIPICEDECVTWGGHADNCRVVSTITALRAEVERLKVLYNGRMRDLHAAQDREVAAQSEAGRIRTQLDEAIHRIEDMLEDDDGQAWKEASKFLLRVKGKNHERR
jgi:hypothetical protein